MLDFFGEMRKRSCQKHASLGSRIPVGHSVGVDDSGRGHKVLERTTDEIKSRNFYLKPATSPTFFIIEKKFSSTSCLLVHDHFEFKIVPVVLVAGQPERPPLEDIV